MKINNINWGKFFILPIIFLSGLSGLAWAQTYNWQQFKTILNEDQIRSHISPYCMPIDPKDTVDPNFCFILQRQCWLDKSGFGPCVVKNCRFGKELMGQFTTAPEGTNSYWYCDPGPNATPAVIPPADCNPLDDIWKDRILRDPSCQRK